MSNDDFDFPIVKPKRPSVTHHDNEPSVGTDGMDDENADDYAKENDGEDPTSHEQW